MGSLPRESMALRKTLNSRLAAKRPFHLAPRERGRPGGSRAGIRSRPPSRRTPDPASTSRADPSPLEMTMASSHPWHQRRNAIARWRRTREKRTRMPNELWASAVDRGTAGRVRDPRFVGWHRPGRKIGHASPGELGMVCRRSTQAARGAHLKHNRRAAATIFSTMERIVMMCLEPQSWVPVQTSR